MTDEHLESLKQLQVKMDGLLRKDPLDPGLLPEIVEFLVAELATRTEESMKLEALVVALTSSPKLSLLYEETLRKIRAEGRVQQVSEVGEALRQRLPD